MRIPIHTVHPVSGAPGAATRGNTANHLADDEIEKAIANQKQTGDPDSPPAIREGTATGDRNPDGRRFWRSQSNSSEKSADQSDQALQITQSQVRQSNDQQAQMISISIKSPDGTPLASPKENLASPHHLESESGGSIDYQA